MKKIIVLLGLAMLAMPVLAETEQQGKMKTCNADAAKKELKGEERKAYMKQCLSAKVEANKVEANKAEAKPETAATPAAKEEKKSMTPQQEKMKTCNADASAKSLKGDERKKFMSQCLKAS